MNDAMQLLTFVFTHASGDEIMFEERPRIEIVHLNVSNDDTLAYPNDTYSQGNLHFKPKRDHFGTEVFNVTAFDDGGWSRGSAGQDFSKTVQVTLTVNSVNDAPSFQILTSFFAAHEDPGPKVFRHIVNHIEKGPLEAYDRAYANEDEQELTFHISFLSGVGMFSQAPTVEIEVIVPTALNYFQGDTIGHLKFLPDQDAFGTDVLSIKLHDDGGTDNNGTDTSVANTTITITIYSVNDAPTFVLPHTVVTAHEDTSNDFDGFLHSISKGPQILNNEASQNLTFRILHMSGDHIDFLTAPHVSSVANGTARLSFVPAENVFGEEVFKLTVFDDGGDNNFTSQTVPFTIRVLPVNDVPSFKLTTAEITIVEDAEANIPDFVSNISAGPYEESQALTFHVMHHLGERMLYDVYPHIVITGSSGVLRFTPAADWYGVEQFNMSLIDDGGAFGTIHRNDNASALVGNHTVSFKITVLPVNDAPTFDHIPTVFEVREDSGQYSLPNFAYHVSRGPRYLSNEFAPVQQNLSFVFTLISGDPSLFAEAPSVEINQTEQSVSNGTLTFRPADHAYGTSVYSLQLVDDGGTSNGGENRSMSTLLRIHVDPENDAPTFTAPTTLIVCEDPNDPPNYVHATFATNVSAGEFESSQSLSFSITPAGGNVSAFEYGPLMTVGGSVGNMVGSLSFRVVPNSHGIANFTLTLSDDGGSSLYSRSNTSQHLSIIFNDRPFFQVRNGLEILGNETTGLIPNFVSDLYLGSEEAREYAYFSLTPLTSRIPSWMPAITTNNNVFGNGDSSLGNQLLITVNVSVATSSLYYNLQPGRFGEVTFSLQLINGGGLGCNGALDRTSRNFSFTVIPVNSAPNFTLSSTSITSFEDQTVELPHFFQDIVPGGWADGERDQELHFKLEWYAGDKVPFDLIEATCFHAGLVDPKCQDGTATLKFLTAPGRYGNVSLRVALVDSGGTARGGVDTSDSRIIHLTVLPVNEKPSFSFKTPNVLVNQDSRCLGLSPTWVMPAYQECDGYGPYVHVHHGFPDALSFGTFENGECDELTECETQTGHFVITSLDANASALLFAEMPIHQHIWQLRHSGLHSEQKRYRGSSVFGRLARLRCH